MIDSKDIINVAESVRIELSADERKLLAFTEAIEAILNYAGDKWTKLELQGVPPTSYVRPLKNVFRPDQPVEGLPLKEALANAPEEYNGCFKVPRIIEE